MGNENHAVRSAIAQEALDWFVLNRGRILSAEQRAAFGAWLKSSPLHVEEYLKTAAMSRSLHQAVDAMDIGMDALIAEARAEENSGVISLWNRRGPDVPEPRARRLLRPRQALAMACAVLLVLVAAVWMQRDGQRFGVAREFVTAHGEQRSWLLPDGTGLNLNSDSAVIVRYNKRERLINMERGQALFRVAHESQRRFRVVAGDAGVIAVGTQFDVWRRPDSTLVTVVEGKVAVFTGEAPLPALAVLPSQALSVSAGEQVQIDDHSRLARSAAANVQQTVAWVQHQIAFDRRPLGDVAEEFNRDGGTPIVIQSERLRAIPITGVFSEYDTDSFVAFISRLDDVAIERTPDHILIVDKVKK